MAQGVIVAAPEFSTVDLFWSLCGSLCTVAAVVLALPWIGRPDITGRLGGGPARTAVASAIVLGVTLILYPWLGREPARDHTMPSRPLIAPVPGALRPPAANLTNISGLSGMLSAPGALSGVAQGASAATAGSMDSAIAALETRLARGGGNDADWELLAKSYDFLGRANDAAQARAHALSTARPAGSASPALSPAALSPAALSPAALSPAALSPASLRQLAAATAARHDRKYARALAIYAELAARGQMNADAWADYADTAATLQNRKLAGEPETYIARALALDPAHPKALWLRASAAEEAARYADAVADWRRLAALLAPDSADAKLVAANLDADTRRQ